MEEINAGGYLKPYIVRESVKPQHMCTDEHECPDIAAPGIDNTQDGHVPVLTFISDPTGQARLEVKQIPLPDGSKHLPFVTVSHVRSHGFGNDQANSLPACRLATLQKLVDGLYDPGLCPKAFWIDTMCIPISGPGRKPAIRQIRRIFDGCDKALVLDSGLYDMTLGTSAEALREIRDSSWIARLWTIQEGSIAENLYFKFRENYRNLDDLLASYEQSEPSKLLPYYSKQQLECMTTGRGIQVRLSQVLNLFYDDLGRVEVTEFGVEDPGPESITFPQREKLRAVLRLGYLSFPKFRYFVDLDEMAGFRPTLNALEVVYRIQGLEDGNTQSLSSGGAIERIRTVLMHMPEF